MTDCWEDDQYSGMTAQPEMRAVPSDDKTATAQTALVEAVEVIAGGPAALLTQAVTPGQTSLPMGLAILGACVVAVIWASNLEKHR